MTERVHGGFAAPSGDFDPIEVRPAGDPFDPNASIAPPSWTGGNDVLGAPDLSHEVAPESGEPPVWAPPVSQPAPDEAPRMRKWRFLPRTLAGRLVVGVVTLVILVFAVAGGATYGLLGSFLANRLDQQVGNSASGNTGLRQFGGCVLTAPTPCKVGNGSAATTGQAVRGQQHLWVNVLDPTGAPLVLLNQEGTATLSATATADDVAVLLPLDATDRQSILNSPNTYRSTTVDGAAVRYTARMITRPDGSSYYLVVGLSSDETTNTLHTLLLIELAIGGGAVLIALGATSVGVRLSLRPLHRVTNTARAVTAELSPEGAGLDRRVEVTEPDTEVGQLAESVNTLLGAVGTQFAARVESERRMRQFMADASHELRTPLTSIRGYAELARMQRAFDDTTEDVPPSRASDTEALARIEHEGNRMSRLVDDLLTLARGDTGSPVESLPLDIAEVVDDAVDGVRAAHPDRPYEVTAAAGLSVYGDHDQLVRVIRNLVNNAAIHTRAGAPIRVRATREGADVVIRVIDSGPGLTPEQAAHVFERFWRSDGSRARSSGGSGLGLAIVASIVAAHRGTVRFDSTVEAGSVVTVSLPAGN